MRGILLFKKAYKIPVEANWFLRISIKSIEFTAGPFEYTFSKRSGSAQHFSGRWQTSFFSLRSTTRRGSAVNFASNSRKMEDTERKGTCDSKCENICKNLGNKMQVTRVLIKYLINASWANKQGLYFTFTPIKHEFEAKFTGNTSPEATAIKVVARGENSLTQDNHHLPEKYRSDPDLFEKLYCGKLLGG